MEDSDVAPAQDAREARHAGEMRRFSQGNGEYLNVVWHVWPQFLRHFVSAGEVQSKELAIQTSQEGQQVFLSASPVGLVREIKDRNRLH
jgi:hypothetical protein